MKYSKTYNNSKNCNTCGEFFTFDAFNDRIVSGSIYKHHNCKKCRRKKLSQYRLLNPETRLLYSIRARSKRNGYETNITIEDIVIPETCPVLGIPIITEFSKRSENTPSVDRIDNNRGYYKDNIIIVSWRANRMKNSFSINELEQLVNFYKNLIKEC